MDNEEKLRQIREALKFSPDNIPLKKIFSTALVEAGFYQEALVEYKTLIKNEPGNIEYKYNLARLYNLMKENSSALVVLETIMEPGCTDKRILEFYASLLIQEGNFKEAVSVFQNLKAADPTYSSQELQNQLADYLSTADQSPAARVVLPGKSAESGIIPFFPVEKPQINFFSIAGMEPVKAQIAMKIINPIKFPAVFKKFGKKAGASILLFGPPGCGKTAAARASAGEIHSVFISASMSDLLNMYTSESEQMLNSFFEYAQTHKPAVLFFDDLDVLGSGRKDLRTQAGRILLNHFQLQMGRLDLNNDSILVLCSTNAPWYLDSSFKKQNKFDSVLFVPPPDFESRKILIKNYLQDKPAKNIDIAAIAKLTNRFSGFDLKTVIDRAVDEKLKIIMKTGKETPLTEKDLKAVIKEIKPAATSWLETARNHCVYSNQNGFYDDLIRYLKSMR